MKRFFKQGNKGFTLIELLVVIAILGTLTAVVTLNVSKFITSGQTESRAVEKSTIQTAVAAFISENGTFNGTTVSPSSYGALSAYFINSANCTYVIPASGIVPNGTGCVK